MTIQDVYQFLKDAGTYYLATVEGDQPRVRPFGTVLLYEGRLYVQTGKRKPVGHQLAANGKVEICAMKGREWIRVAGTLVEDPRPEPGNAMLDAYPSLKAMYHVGDGNTEVLYFKDAVATVSTFGQEPKVVRF